MTLEQILAALQNLGALSVEEISDLRGAISELYAELRDGDLDDDAIDALRELADARTAIDADIVRRDAERAEREAAIAELDAVMSDDDDEPAAEDETTEPADGETEEVTAEDEVEVIEERVPVAASTRPADALRRIAGRQPARNSQPPASEGNGTLVASTDVPGFAAGSRVITEDDFGRALASRHATLGGVPLPDGQQVRYSVLRANQTFADEARIPENHTAEQAESVFAAATRRHLEAVERGVSEAGPDALLAAGGPCAPCTQASYDIEFMASNARPFTDAFPSVNFPRGRVCYRPPLCYTRPGANDMPAIGRSITRAEDEAGYVSSDPAGTTPDKDCERIDCPTDTTECGLDIILKCLTIGNWIDRSYPEYVRVWRELVDVHYSVRFEQKHMAQVVAGSTLITAGPGTFGATLELNAQILTMRERIMSARRLAANTQWRWIIPTWVVSYLKIDLSRYLQMTEDMAGLRISDAQLLGWFRQHGLNISTYVDESGPTAQGDNAVLALPGAGALAALPNSFRSFLFPEGTWVRGSGGMLDLGIVRDSSLNSVNDFQVFMEEWSSMCRPGGCDSFVVDHQLCPSGLAAGTAVLTC